MNQIIIVSLSVVLLLFIWAWIGLTIFNRMKLEKKIEKLDNITNPLPEEERELRQLKDLRMIEQSKVSSARWVVGIFMLGLIAWIATAPWWNPLYNLFGAQTLVRFTTIAIILLTFICLPILVGLFLAGTRKPEKPIKVKQWVEKIEQNTAASS